MFCLTSVTAEYAATRYLNGYRDFASTIATRSFEHWLGKGFDSSYANYDANRRWEAVDDGGHADTFYGARFIVGEDDEFLTATRYMLLLLFMMQEEIFLNVVGRISFTSSI